MCECVSWIGLSGWVRSNMTSVTHTHPLRETDRLRGAHNQHNSLSKVHTLSTHFPLSSGESEFPPSSQTNGKNVWTNTHVHIQTRGGTFSTYNDDFVLRSPTICTLLKWRRAFLLSTITKQRCEVPGPQWRQCRVVFECGANSSYHHSESPIFGMQCSHEIIL